jgi:hypothetical protein
VRPLTFEAFKVFVEGKRVAGGLGRQQGSIIVVCELLDTRPI